MVPRNLHDVLFREVYDPVHSRIYWGTTEVWTDVRATVDDMYEKMVFNEMVFVTELFDRYVKEAGR